jgi:hypothetical protein
MAADRPIPVSVRYRSLTSWKTPSFGGKGDRALAVRT